MHEDTTRDLQVIALKRSGHHAFITWVCEWKGGPTFFINNVLPSNPPRFGSLSLYRREMIDESDIRLLSYDVDAVLAQSKYDVVLNFEGRASQSIEKFEAALRKNWGRPPGLRVLFLRDPLNNFASLVKRVPKNSFRATLKCISQVFRFCEYMDHVRSAAHSGRYVFDEVVLFTRWQLDETYRQQLASTFGLTSSRLKGELSKFGGGSSFSGLAFDPTNDYEQLFSRWRQMKDDALFLAIFRSERLLEAVNAYYDCFGEHELVQRAAVHELMSRAQRSSAAASVYRRWIHQFERYQIAFDKADCVPMKPLHLVYRSYLKTILGARVFFRDL